MLFRSIGSHYQYIGGAWSSFATGSVSNAADHTAGKVDIASVSEAAAGTATDATSGAINVIPVSLLKQNSTGAAQGNVPALNSSSVIDPTIGGTGVASMTAYAPLFGGTSSTGPIQSGSVGTSGQVLTSNGAGALPTMQSPKVYEKVVYVGYSDSSLAGQNSTSVVAVDTHQYVITANDLINGVGYEMEIAGTFNWTAGSLNIGVGFGTTSIAFPSFTPTNSRDFFAKCRIFGTASAGPSVSVRGEAFIFCNGDNFPRFSQSSVSVATNGSLTLNLIVQYGISQSGNGLTAKMAKITKFSSTAF